MSKDREIVMKLYGNDIDAFEEFLFMSDEGEDFQDAVEIRRGSDFLEAVIDYDEADDLAEAMEEYAGGLDELVHAIQSTLGNRNPGALGPSMDYEDNPKSQTVVRFSDGNEFNLNTCDHKELDASSKKEIDKEVKERLSGRRRNPPRVDEDEVDEQAEVEITAEDQGPIIPPWARWQQTFNTPPLTEGASADLDFDEGAGEVISADFSPFEERRVAANRGRVKGEPAKVRPLPLTTPTRLRVEKLDESLQGWAYPISRGRYLVRWSNGDTEEIGHKDAHHVNKTIEMDDIMAEVKRSKGERFSPKELGFYNAKDLLGENDKLSKGRKYKYYAVGLSLSPFSIAGVGNLCPYASKGCSEACLNMSGKGEMINSEIIEGKERTVAWVQEARKRRTYLFMRNRKAFKKYLYDSIKKIDAETKMKRLPRGGVNRVYGFNLCIRLNVLSDVQWEGLRYKGKSMMEHFPRLNFYDYTKIIPRMERFLSGDFPKNYYLIFSWSESDAKYAFEVLKRGGSVAVPFDTEPWLEREGEVYPTYLPKWWNGFKVVDADVYDCRFADAEFYTDPKNISDRWTEQDRQELVSELNKGRGFVCGLRLKGKKARRDLNVKKEKECRAGALPTSMSGGFIQYANDAGMRPGGDPDMYVEQCDVEGRVCEVKAPKGERPDQQYIPTCNLTEAKIHPDPLALGESYQQMLTRVGMDNAAAEKDLGFLGTWSALKKLGLTEE